MLLYVIQSMAHIVWAIFLCLVAGLILLTTLEVLLQAWPVLLILGVGFVMLILDRKKRQNAITHIDKCNERRAPKKDPDGST
jgi:hypothetical protein